MIKVHLKNSIGVTYIALVPQNSKWSSVAQSIFKQTNIPPEEIELYFHGNLIDQEASISSINFRRTDFILFCTKQPKLKEDKSKPYNEEDMLRYLSGLHFSREHSIAALKYCNYNFLQARQLLIMGDLPPVGSTEESEPDQSFAS